MESGDSSTDTHQPQLPPGFRFHPTDEELVVHYLKKKANSSPLPVSIIADIDLYKFDPWELPAKATFGEQEWYFFSPRDRKYPNGARPNRAATSGYWKATGTDKPVLTCGGAVKVGVKKALVFYCGKPPKGIKTDWIMHEYRLTDNNKPHANKPPGCDLKKTSLRLDDWVLCRIYKKNTMAQRTLDHESDSMDEMLRAVSVGHHHQPQQTPKPTTTNYVAALLDAEQHRTSFYDGVMGGESNPTSLKRTPLYWMDEGPSSSPVKRFHAEESDGERSGDAGGSFAALLGQIPATSEMHQQTMVGSIGDGMFRQTYNLPGMNWYS